MKFTVFTHVIHRASGKKYLGYSPYVREMNIWLNQVEEVEVVGTRRLGDLEKEGHGDGVAGRSREKGMAYEHSHVSFTEVPSFDFLSLSSSIKSVVKIPYIFLGIIGAMRRAEHLHLRCPGNIGLLACIVQIFFPSKPKSAKYAGNWDPKAKQPWTYRLQKWLLSNTFLTRNMQVLVYGNWPGQTKNILPFFTASFSEEDKVKVPKKAFFEPFIFLFVGNLVEGKRPMDAIKIVEELNLRLKEGTNREIRANSIRARLEIYGDGPEREKLKTYVAKNQLEEFVTFKGSRPLEELKKAYQKAHFVILPSRSEGWPKAIAEGMFFGCIPIATPVSCVPWMLDFGNRGILLSDQANGQPSVAKATADKKLKANSSNEWSVVSGQWSSDLEKIRNLLTDPERMKRISEQAKKWSQQYTLKKFEAAIQEVLNQEQKTTTNKQKSARFTTHR